MNIMEDKSLLIPFRERGDEHNETNYFNCSNFFGSSFIWIQRVNLNKIDENVGAMLE